MPKTKPVFLLMPEWQGSSSARAMQIADGAEALREDLPAAATHEVAVPLEAGDAMGTPVARLSSLLRAREAARRAIEERAADSPAVILGGDCATSLAGLEAVVREHGSERIAVLWFDAHPDLQHPSTSPSGAASGMTLRHALGDGAPDLRSEHPIDASLVTLIGARAFDPEELAEIEERGIGIVAHEAAPGTADPEAFATAAAPPAPEALAATVAAGLAASGATHLYVHLDLDVLDPAEFSAVHTAVPFGLSVAQLTSAIRGAVSTLPLAGAAICEFAPAGPEAAAEDLPTVLRILGALTSGGAA